MSDINRVNITGRLTRDPELRSTQGGTSILQIGLAVNDRRKNPQSGEWEDMPNYVDCIIFGARANGIQPYLTKGTKVAVEGKLRWSSWEKDDGRHSKIEVIVDEIVLMSGGQQGQQQGGYQQAPRQTPQQPQYGQQMQQGYQQPMQPQMAPQMAPQQQAAPQYQQPMAAAPQQQYQQQAPQPEFFDEDIPF